MKTYCLIAAAITLIFATAANATPRPEHGSPNADRGSHSQRGDKRQHSTRRGHAKDQGDRSHAANKRSSQREGGNYRDNDRRDGHRGRSPSRHREKKQVVKHQQHHTQNRSRHVPQRRSHEHKNHNKKHHSHNDINWLINVGLGSYYTEPAYPSHRIYYQRQQGGECFRVEERSDRTVWIEVPYYKCG